MSYILDALKKSDEQRHTGEAPNVASVHAGYRNQSVETSGRWWLIGLAALCSLLAGLVIWQLIVSGNLATTFNSYFPTDSVDKSIQIQADADDGTNESYSTEPAISLKKPIKATKTEASVPRQAQVKPKPVEEVWEVSNSRQSSLETLQFSFHVYSTNPSRRAIIINGTRRREGQTINGDWSLQEITADGVILSDDLGAVHLSVVSGW